MSTDITKFHGDKLLNLIRNCFKKIKDHRIQVKTTYPLEDVLMSGLAIFILKFPSLLKFEQWYKQEKKALQQNLWVKKS